MIPSFYKSSNKDFTLIQGDCVEILSRFRFEFDMIFADPPYFLSGGGITCKSGKVACVDKGEWDRPMEQGELDAYNYRWLSACREHMKDNATIWISGTHHNIFSVQQQLIKLGFKILNVITWAKTNPPPNITCRYFTHSTEFIIWARKSAKVPHYYNYVASSCHWALGKKLRKASHTETFGCTFTPDSCQYQTRSLDSGPV